MEEARLYEELNTASDYLKTRLGQNISVFVFTGTGLSGILPQARSITSIPYGEVPHLVQPGVEGHAGVLEIVEVEGQKVGLFKGRFHHYEGRTMWEITFPVRCAARLGSKLMVFINAAGGLREDMEVGDVIPISDHIYQFPDQPLRGLNRAVWGPRFPDPKSLWTAELRSEALRLLALHHKETQAGVYVGLPGPALETLAELRFWKNNGADLIGMSTLPEAIVAQQCGQMISGLSAVTNIVDPAREVEEVELADVIAGSKRALPILNKILPGLISSVFKNH
jgi:purine-nucleoside phosphorylase